MKQVVASVVAGNLKTVVYMQSKFLSTSVLGFFLLLENNSAKLGCLPGE